MLVLACRKNTFQKPMFYYLLLALTYNNIESFVNFEQQPKVDIASS